MATIAVDFDAVREDGAKQHMTQLKKAGHTIQIISTDAPADVKKSLDKWGIPYDRVTTLQTDHDLYVSSKAMRFGAWNLVIAALPWNLPEKVGGKKVK